MDLYSRADFWTIANEQGDCEDYALRKRQLLIERGFPAEDLRLTVVKDETGAGHAILTADVDGVTYCLDNRFPTLMGANQLKSIGYEFLWRQAKGGESKWVRILQ
jgi:predicted transglutaminase-like cysteine proteinase